MKISYQIIRRTKQKVSSKFNFEIKWSVITCSNIVEVEYNRENSSLLFKNTFDELYLAYYNQSKVSNESSNQTQVIIAVLEGEPKGELN